MDKHSVIQLEVFHINFNNNTLEGVLQEAYARARENYRLAIQDQTVGTGIKTVIRFYDIKGEVIECLDRIATYKAESAVYVNAPRNNWLTNNWARWKIRKIEEKIYQELEQIRLFSLSQVKGSRSNKTVIAVQKRDYTFRPIRNNEWYDLMSQITFGQMWIFAFKPTDLLKVKGLQSAGFYMS